jgi:hypothetical protein
MKQITNQTAIQMCEKRVAAGHHVDSRLQCAVKIGEIFLLTIADSDSFLSLIWQVHSDSRFLTPEGGSRTLKDVATRFIQKDYSFSRLASNPPLDQGCHNPTWFEKCVPIAESFSYEHFSYIAITPANDHERRESPNGTFYIFDGIHKTLVLSTLLLKGKVTFQALTAMLLIPRRS